MFYDGCCHALHGIQRMLSWIQSFRIGEFPSGRGFLFKTLFNMKIQKEMNEGKALKNPDYVIPWKQLGPCSLFPITVAYNCVKLYAGKEEYSLTLFVWYNSLTQMIT